MTLLLPAKVPLAPVAGAVNVTTAPFTGLLPLSTTVAASSAGNAELTGVLCGVPLVGVIAAGDPVVLESEKLAEPEVPVIVAVML
jgi:hypothetical protein